MNTYQHKGKAFDKSIAIELIIEIFQSKQHIQRSVIEDNISQRHKDRGGLPPEPEKTWQWQTTLALDALKVLQFADNPNRGYWNFQPVDEMVARVEYFRRIAHSTKFRK